MLLGCRADSEALLTTTDRREEYRPGMERHFAEYDHKGFRMRSLEVSVYGDIAIDRGAYEEVHTRFGDGRRSTTSGAYIHGLRKNGEGLWQIIRVLWS